MEKKHNPVFLSFFLLSAVIIFCLCGILFFGAILTWIPEQIEQAVPASIPTPFPVDELPQPNGNNTDIPDDLLKQMQQIQIQVIQERGLLPETEIMRQIISSEELRTNVEKDFFKEYSREEAEIDRKVLVALGLINPEEDLISLYKDLYSEQIAGYYDNEEKEMYVIGGAEFGPQEQMTYAHEYTHVLQDQVFDIKKGLLYGEEECVGQEQRCAAIQALIEGDATLSEYRWQSNYFGKEDYREWLSFNMALESPVFDQIPPYFQESLMFPYQYGLNFVNQVFDQSGWDGVNELYKKPPVSTEQIMHPSLYPDHLPIPVYLPDIVKVLPNGMTLLDEGELGEWDLGLVLSTGIVPGSQLPVNQARAAARGWGGDKYQIFGYPQKHTESVWVLCIMWDSSVEAAEFMNSFNEYGDNRWAYGSIEKWENQSIWTAGGIVHSIVMDGNQTCWIDSPSKSVNDRLMPYFKE